MPLERRTRKKMANQKLPPDELPPDLLGALPTINRSASEAIEPTPDDPMGQRVKVAKPEWMTQDIEEPDTDFEFDENGRLKPSATRVARFLTFFLFGVVVATCIKQCSSMRKNARQDEIEQEKLNKELRDAFNLLANEEEKKAAQEEIQNVTQWHYQNWTDALGKQRAIAAIQSMNTINLGFPYQGAQRGSLMLRRTEGEKEAMFSIERGQIVCGIDSCTVDVRIGKRPAFQMQASGTSDYSTTTLFLNPPSKIWNAAAEGFDITIAVPIYQEGNRTFTFSTGGLEGRKL